MLQTVYANLATVDLHAENYKLFTSGLFEPNDVLMISIRACGKVIATNLLI